MNKVLNEVLRIKECKIRNECKMITFLSYLFNCIFNKTNKTNKIEVRVEEDGWYCPATAPKGSPNDIEDFIYLQENDLDIPDCIITKID